MIGIGQFFRIYLFTLLFSPFFFLCVTSSLLSQKGTKSDSSTFKIENVGESKFFRVEKGKGGILRLQGRIRIKFFKGSVVADQVIVDTERQEFYAEGNIIYTEKDGTKIRSERMLYNATIKQGILYNASGYKNPIYFIGKNIRLLAKKQFFLSHIRFTTNAVRPPHYDFYAWKIYFYEDKTFLALGVIGYIGGIPLLPLPLFYYTQKGTGLITQVGFSMLQGFLVQNSYSFHIPSYGKEYLKFLPQNYLIWLDYYQNTGTSSGLEFSQRSPWIDYRMSFGYANYKRYTVENTGNGINVSNQIQVCPENFSPENPCQTREESYHWWKAYIDLNQRSKYPKKDHIRNIYLHYESYAHYLYEYEFGRRNIPSTTIEAIYQNQDDTRGTVRPRIDFFAIYDEQWKTFRIRAEIRQKRVWIDQGNFVDSRYELAEWILPQLMITKKFFLWTIPWFRTPVVWDHNIFVESKREFQKGEIFYNRTHNQYYTNLRASFPFLYWLYWKTRVNYGLQKISSDLEDEEPTFQKAVEQEAERESYQYVLTENQVKIGVDPILFFLTHRFKDSFAELRGDIPSVNTFGFDTNQNVNETEINFTWYPFYYAFLNFETAYDHRQNIDASPRERWHYPVLQTALFFDWLNLFRRDREDLSSRNKIHFVNTYLVNQYVADPVFLRSHSNLFGLTFDLGGFDLWPISRLRYFEMGIYWYHVFFDTSLDHLLFSMKLDIQLYKWFYLELEMNSRASEPNRYNSQSRDRQGNPNSVGFFQDLANSTGLRGASGLREAILNLASFSSALILDLEDWEFRLSYRLEQRSSFGGVSGLNSVIFYDHGIYFELSTLVLGKDRYSGRPSRFLIGETRPSIVDF